MVDDVDPESVADAPVEVVDSPVESEEIVDNVEEIPPEISVTEETETPAAARSEEQARLIERLVAKLERDPNFIAIQHDSYETIATKLTEILGLFTKSELEEITTDNNTFVAAFTQMFYRYVDGVKEMADTIAKQVAAGDNIGTKFETPNGVLGASTATNLKLSDAAKNNPRAAGISYLAKRRRVRRIPLYNSGFTVSLDSPSLNDLHMFNIEVSDNDNMWGRILGHHHFYFSDHIIKKAIMDLFVRHVRDATLVGWEKGNTLMQSISFNDFNTICWAFSTLLFPDGYDYEVMCTNKNCTWHHKELIDLRKLCLVNFTKMGDEAIRFMMRNSVTREELGEYRKLLKTTKVIGYDGADWHFRVPLMSEYLEAARKYTAEIMIGVQSTDVESIDNALRYNYMRRYGPWISQIVDGKDISSTPAEIDNILNIVSLDRLPDPESNEKPWFFEIDEFIRNSTMSFIGYPTVECPICHTKLGGDNPYTVFNPEQHFFIGAVKVLTQH